MMILAIDTASRSCSVAVLDGEQVLAEINDVSGQTHTRHLMIMVDRAIAMSVGRFAKIDGFAVTKGPGSFTGLRIGISAAKGLAQAADKPLVGVSSMEALAWQVFQRHTLIIPMLDARRKEVYTARYIREGESLTSLGAEQALTPEQAVAGVRQPCVLVGDGAVAYRDRLHQLLGDHLQMALPFQQILRASTVAFLARPKLAGDLDERMLLKPHYIRKSYVDDGRHNAG
jgi:tRNA threonylcarbamoyladenosine biosynthesis protein TsaB